MIERDYERDFKRQRKEALDRAWSIRNFEIDLYWKRAGYFWAIIGALFAAYGVVVSSQKVPLLILPVASLGLVMSLAWYLVNRASSAWQRNWETHIDLLEDAETGPLYKTIVDGRRAYNPMDLLGPLDISPSKISNASSLFVVATWLGLIIHALPADWLPESMKLAPSETASKWFTISITTIAVVVLLVGCRTGRKSEAVYLRRRVRFWPGERSP